MTAESAAELLASPETALHKIREHPKTPAAVLFILLGWLSFLTAVFVVNARSVAWPTFCFLFFAGGSLLVFLSVLKSAWLHVLAQGFGGRGKMSSLFAMLASALLPFHLFLPIALAGQGRMPFLIFLFWTLAIVWMARIGLQSIRINYGFSFARSLVVAFAPVVGGLVLLSTVLVFFLSLLALKLLALLSRLPS